MAEAKKDSRFDPYARRQHGEGVEEIALTTSTHLQRELEAKGEGNAEVYDWHITKLPENQVLDPWRVRDIVTALYSDAQHSYSLGERANWEVDDHRRVLVEANSIYDAFTQTHPRLFLAMTERVVTADKRMHIMNLITLKAVHKHDGTPLEQQQKEVSMYFKHNFTRAALPGEEEEEVAAGRGYRGEMVKLPAPDSYQNK